MAVVSIPRATVMKQVTALAVLLGSLLIALSVTYNTTQGAHYQIVRLTEQLAEYQRRRLEELVKHWIPRRQSNGLGDHGNRLIRSM